MDRFRANVLPDSPKLLDREMAHRLEYELDDEATQVRVGEGEVVM